MVEELRGAHNKECDAYNLFKNITNFPLPEVYYVEHISAGHPGVIVLEDLSHKATTIGLFRSATKQHCLNVARHLGTFQVS